MTYFSAGAKNRIVRRNESRGKKKYFLLFVQNKKSGEKRIFHRIFFIN